MPSIDQSTKFFNTAIIATKATKISNTSSKLNALVRSKAFQHILKATREYALEAGIPEEQAAEEIVALFRDMDSIWDSYIFQEGLEKLKGNLNN